MADTVSMALAELVRKAEEQGMWTSCGTGCGC
jgi:hypothetical protein